MAHLQTDANVAKPDDVFEWLADLHAGRSEAESRRINARLILLLINHIGELPVIREAITIAGARATNEL